MEQEKQYGGFWIRLLALAADTAILFVASIVVMIACSFLGKPGGAIASVVLLIVTSLYWPVMHASERQATYGKAMLGLKVTDVAGERISFMRSCGRALAWVVSCVPLLLGFVMAAFTARKQALHDFIASTCVEREGPAHIAGAITVTVVGFVGPMIAIPMFFMALFMGMIAAMFGDFIGEMRRIAPQLRIEIPAPKSALPPRAPGTAPTPSPAPAPRASSPATDADFDRLIGAPLTGLEKPGTTRAGPAILELSAMFSNTLWLKVHLPLPASTEREFIPGPRVTIERVLDQAGNNYHDAANTFETSEFFLRASMSAKSTPVAHLSGIRSVHLRPGLAEAALQKVDGQITITLPVDPRVVAFETAEAGNEKPAHDAAVALVSVSGGAVRWRYRGIPDHYLGVRAFGADGKPLAPDARQVISGGQPVDQELTVNYKGAPARVEVVVAARLIERSYPFSVAKGSVAGPPPAR